MEILDGCYNWGLFFLEGRGGEGFREGGGGLKERIQGFN